MSSPDSSPDKGTTTHPILILGGNIAGVTLAHHLLRHTIPALNQLNPHKTYTLHLLTPSPQFFWKIPTPRSLSKPSQIPTSTLLLPIAPAFAQYSAREFQLHIGLASAVNEASKTVTYKTDAEEANTLAYASLIIATGATSASPLWSLHDDPGPTASALDATRATLQSAQSILIAGGGPVGVETAGEITCAYPSAQLTLLSGGTRVLAGLHAKTSAAAERRLGALGVTVVHGKKVFAHTSYADGRKQKVRMWKSEGSDEVEEVEVDLFLDCTGGTANAGFLPPVWLDERRRVATEEETMRVKGAPGVYAIGDVASYSKGNVFDVNSAVGPLSSSLARDVAEGLGRLAEVDGKGAFKVKPFKPMRDTMLVPIGDRSGVGQIMGWGVPGWFVWLVKGRGFFAGMGRKTLEGK